ncbi:MAG: hypothetical protein ACREPE_07790 [Lysobacter sp.]
MYERELPSSYRTSGKIFPPRNGLARTLADEAATGDGAAPVTSTKPPATETIARRTGAMVNEIDFPGFVAQLVHGTFDAIVDASIRQMESYSSLVSAVAKTVDQFTEENVSTNQARDWLATRYPGDVKLLLPDGTRTEPELAPQVEGLEPAWLSDFGVEGEELTTELIEQRVLPQVRAHIGAERQQLLATMVLLGMNRVVVRDGSISTKVMFRAAASDAAGVQYATSSDPKAVANWGERGSQTYSGQTTTMVSTLGVNAQNESSVRADLFGEVKLNFVSETLPLERLADAAKIALVQRNSPNLRATSAPAVAAPAIAAPTAPPAQGGA